MGITWKEFTAEAKDDFNFLTLYRMASDSFNPLRVRSIKEFAALLHVPQRTMENWIADADKDNHRDFPRYVLLQSAYLLYVMDMIELSDLMAD